MEFETVARFIGPKDLPKYVAKMKRDHKVLRPSSLTKLQTSQSGECSRVYLVKASLGKEIGNPYCAIAMADDLAATSETCRNILAAT
jgi:hypothetical protein